MHYQILRFSDYQIGKAAMCSSTSKPGRARRAPCGMQYVRGEGCRPVREVRGIKIAATLAARRVFCNLMGISELQKHGRDNRRYSQEKNMRARADWRFMSNRGGQALTRLLYGLRSTSAGGRKRCFTPQSKALAREWSCYCISAEDGLATWKSAIQSRRVGTPGRRAVSGVKGDNAQIL